MTNKIVSTKTTSAIFLAIVLVTGTITALSVPSFMTGTNAQAQPYYGNDNRYNSYGSDYGMDNNDRESYDKRSYGNDYGYESQYQPSYKPAYPSYGKDDRDKSKDSKNVDIKKIKCNNININLNNGQGGTGNSDNGNTTNGDGNKTDGFKKINRDGFTFICINNNNNEAGGGNQTISPEPQPTTTNLTVTKNTDCDSIFGTICATFDPQITVTGKNPTPSSFPVSDTPVVVTLDAGAYSVSEEGFVPGLAQCAGFDGGQQISGNIYACTNFNDDCSGDISAGEELSCTIDNTVIDTTTVQRAQLNVTKLVTCEEIENGESLIPSIQQVTGPTCEQLEGLITEDQFNIFVTGTNPTPSQFTGSENGIIVTLGAGFYAVAETPDPSIIDDIEDLEGDSDTIIEGPFPSFTGDCLPAAPNVFSTTGNIATGEFQTCNIENNFNITRTSTFTGGSSITTQETADSSELTTLEKLAKLKQQWLDQLP